MLHLFAAFDFSNILTFVTDNILPIILGGQLIPVNKPGTPYQPFIKWALSLITGRKTVEVPIDPLTPGTPLPVVPGSPPSLIASILPLLIPFITQLSHKPPIATVVTPPDPAAIPNDPNSLIAWLMKLLSSPEAPVVITPPVIDPTTIPTVDAKFEHFVGCFQSMVDMYPDADISAVSKNGDWDVKKSKRAEVKVASASKSK